MITKHSETKKTIVIYVQHLLGSGHFVRAFYIANEIAKHAHVYLITGGFALHDFLKNKTIEENLSIIQLPVIQSLDASFQELVDDKLNPINEDYFSLRKQKLINIVQDIASKAQISAAIIETFPFGRRQLKDEIISMLDTLKSTNSDIKLFSSIRDVLQQRKNKRYVETISLINQYFDYVLVHSDDHLIKLSDSFPLTEGIQDKLLYSGYIYPVEHNTMNAKSFDVNVDWSKTVIVAAGGSNQGFDLIKSCMLAKPLTDLADYHWLFFYSPSINDEEIKQLKCIAHKDNNIHLQTNRDDYPLLLKKAYLSVSQGGYNTILDILNTNIKALVIPFQQQNETEQRQRASVLDKNKRIVSYDDESICINKLAKYIDKAHRQEMKTLNTNMDGIKNTCQMVFQVLNNEI